MDHLGNGKSLPVRSLRTSFPSHPQIVVQGSDVPRRAADRHRERLQGADGRLLAPAQRRGAGEAGAVAATGGAHGVSCWELQGDLFGGGYIIH